MQFFVQGDVVHAPGLPAQPRDRAMSPEELLGVEAGAAVRYEDGGVDPLAMLAYGRFLQLLADGLSQLIGGDYFDAYKVATFSFFYLNRYRQIYCYRFLLLDYPCSYKMWRTRTK